MEHSQYFDSGLRQLVSANRLLSLVLKKVESGQVDARPYRKSSMALASAILAWTKSLEQAQPHADDVSSSSTAVANDALVGLSTSPRANASKDFDSPAAGAIDSPVLVYSEQQLSELPDRFARVWRYYASLTKETAIPTRNQFDPMELASDLRYVTLLDVERGRYGEKSYKFRVVGTAQAEWAKADSTGKDFSHLPDGEEKNRFIKTLDVVVNGQQPVLNHLYLPFAEREHIPMKALFLPLSNDAGKVMFVLYVSGYPKYQY